MSSAVVNYTPMYLGLIMLVLHNTPKTFGGTIQIHPSMKKEARILCNDITVLMAATEYRFIQTFSTISIA